MHSIIISKSTSSLGVRTSSNIITNIASLIQLEPQRPTGIVAGGGHPKIRNHHRIIAPVRSLKNLPGIVEPALQRNHVATDVLVLLADTVTYHLRGVRKPRHRHWPTRPPPNKDRVNNGLPPHQPTSPGRQHLPIPTRRSPVPNMALIKQASTAESTTTRMRDRHRRRRCGNYFYIQLNKVVLLIKSTIQFNY